MQPALQEQLQQKGLRATRQRLLILDSLLQLPGHPTAEQVYSRLLTESPTISLGTVYKTLGCFAQAGLVRRVAAADGSARRYDANCGAHHHLHCTATQQIVDYNDPQLDALLRDFFAARGLPGFLPHSFSLHISGTKI